MKAGDRVVTPHGPGTIIDKDLSESRAWQWPVMLDEPLGNRASTKDLFYWEKELRLIEDPPSADCKPDECCRA